MDHSTKLEHIKASMNAAKEGIKQAEACRKLIQTPEFKEVVEGVYFETYALNQIQQIANADEKQLKEIHQSLYAISEFRAFLQGMMAQKAQHEKALVDLVQMEIKEEA